MLERVFRGGIYLVRNVMEGRALPGSMLGGKPRDINRESFFLTYTFHKLNASVCVINVRNFGILICI